ncbi:hypothetical protein QFC19_005138 [Naganishia cerealis]|uniref:Uncharacterized protein n=1 Tax=Naganishia cerealis TaxID=610337 RepID=A0ACC2VRG0_9TREE|nr:hypothetical protein QFC19_005138 [Naganishia cerealis]
MRPTLLLRAALPPLPPRAAWPQVFPNKNFSIVNRLRPAGTVGIQKGKRTQVADHALARRVVERLGVNKEDVVIEAYPGMGFLTRALLDLGPTSHPRKILTIEPSLDFNIRGLGLASDLALEGEQDSLNPAHQRSPHHTVGGVKDGEAVKRGLLEQRKTLHDQSIEDMIKHAAAAAAAGTSAVEEHLALPPGQDGWQAETATSGKDTYTLRAFPSKDDPSLTIIDGTMFDWKTAAVLESDGLLSDVQRREWNERTLSKPAPDRHYSGLGHGRAAGLAVDRMCGDAIMVVPLGTGAHEFPGQANAVRSSSTSPPPLPDKYAGNPDAEEPFDPSDPLLSTDQDLYYPKPRRTTTEQKQPPRPGMMALTLTPRPDPQIEVEDKDVWDYVLRRMFVMAGSPLSVAINNLGMGASNLIPKLTNQELPHNQRIDPDKWIREYTVQDWALIVKAFKAWPFAPDVLVLGGLLEEDNDTRQVGSGM